MSFEILLPWGRVVLHQKLRCFHILVVYAQVDGGVILGGVDMVVDDASQGGLILLVIKVVKALVKKLDLVFILVGGGVLGTTCLWLS